MTLIVIGNERWHVIEFPEVLLRRWARALPRTWRFCGIEIRRPTRFFPVTYCGTVRWVNPLMVTYMRSVV